MPRHCAVPMCKSNYPNDSKVNGVVATFAFPRDEAQKAAWITAIRRHDFIPTVHSAVCKRHFVDEDFRPHLQRLFLKEDAVPSVFPLQMNGCVGQRKSLKENPENVNEFVGDDGLDDFEDEMESPIQQIKVEEELIIDEPESSDSEDSYSSNSESDFPGFGDDSLDGIEYDENKLACHCTLCKEAFQDITDLHRHILKHKGNGQKRKLFQCSVCDSTYEHPSRLVRHALAHSEARPYKCKYCLKFYKDRYQMRQHEITHKEKSYKCKVCKHKFRIKQLYDTHMATHRNSKGFKCDECVNTFDNKKDLLNHKYDSHMDGHPCNLCDFKANSMKELTTHKRKHKPEKGRHPAKCPVCDKVFTRKVARDRHVAELHMLKCMYCAQIFQFKTLLNDHVNSEHASIIKQSLKCQFCGKVYCGKFSLERHMSRYHALKCKHCEKVFPRDQDLVKHMNDDHSVTVNFKCEICNKTFVGIYSLQRHNERLHTFKCDHCEEVFTRKANLIKHVKTDHPSKVLKCLRPVKCGICSEQFENVNHFPMHYVKNHNGERCLFKCVHCDQITETERSFENHSKIHKPGNYECVECYICKNLFCEKNQLIRHFQAIHPDQEIKIVFKCSQCEEVFDDRKAIKIHSKVHEGASKTEVEEQDDSMDIEIGMYECDKCDKVFESFHELENHGKDHISKASTSTYVAPGSSVEVKEESMVENFEKLECINCEAVFDSTDELEKHSKIHIKEEVIFN